MRAKRERAAVRMAICLVWVLVLSACASGDDEAATTGDGGTTDATEAPVAEESDESTEDPAEEADGSQESSGGAAPGVSDDTITWGVVTDVSGPTNATQVPWQEGLQAYIDQVNEAGGVHGRQIDLVVEDDQFDVALGQQAVERLTDFPVFGMSGINNSSLQVAVADQVRDGDIPVVGSISTTRDIVAPFNPSYFASWCSYADMADVAVPYMAEQTGADAPRVVAAALDVASGVEWTGEVSRVVESLGGEVLEILQPTGAVDASAEAREIESFAPDFVAVHGSAPSAQSLLTAMAERGLSDTPTIGIANIAVASIWEDLAGIDQQMGENFQVVHCYTPPAAADADANAELVAAAEEAGLTTEAMFTGGWLVGTVVVEGLEAAGPDPTREAFIAGLEGTTIDTGGLSAEVAYSADDHQAFQTTRPYRYDYDAGQLVPVGEFADYADLVTDAYQQG